MFFADHIIVTNTGVVYIQAMSLRTQVEELLPNWERWYPSLFDAANDLGLIKAEVCDPNSLLLSSRHSKVRQEAANAHREKWGGQNAEILPVRRRKTRRTRR
ncbi:MAG: hypothetical protein ACR2Q3_04480 [Woeseiaceae bacterium]